MVALLDGHHISLGQGAGGDDDAGIVVVASAKGLCRQKRLIFGKVHFHLSIGSTLVDWVLSICICFLALCVLSGASQ